MDEKTFCDFIRKCLLSNMPFNGLNPRSPAKSEVQDSCKFVQDLVIACKFLQVKKLAC